MRRRALEWGAVGEPRVVEEEIRDPARGEILVEAEWGAVSAGSERLVASGRLPEDLALDDNFDGRGRFPLRYGYSLVGRVVGCGEGVDKAVWDDRRVFTFSPHATHIVVADAEAKLVPDRVDARTATLYPHTETALTLMWDGTPRHGEAVLVFGLGLVGVLTARLASTVAGLVVAIDPDERRRSCAREALPGVTVCAGLSEAQELLARYGGASSHRRYRGFDLVYELSGRTSVLDESIAAAAFGGRIVLGSWYGSERSDIALGGRFHRSRVSIVSSQVSTIPTELAARFDYDRRAAIAWGLLSTADTGRISSRETAFEELPAVMRDLVAGARFEPWILVRYAKENEDG